MPFQKFFVKCQLQPGGHLNIKMSSYQYRDPHVKDEMALRPFYQWWGSQPVSSVSSFSDVHKYYPIIFIFDICPSSQAEEQGSIVLFGMCHIRDLTIGPREN